MSSIVRSLRHRGRRGKGLEGLGDRMVIMGVLMGMEWVEGREVGSDNVCGVRQGVHCYI